MNEKEWVPKKMHSTGSKFPKAAGAKIPRLEISPGHCVIQVQQVPGWIMIFKMSNVCLGYPTLKTSSTWFLYNRPIGIL
ncbi:MAG: hypothetical protein JWR61_4809 [Ferruginibacter sp.]|nr:hypothetical protein [Ferruginibacter sp.]